MQSSEFNHSPSTIGSSSAKTSKGREVLHIQLKAHWKQSKKQNKMNVTIKTMQAKQEH